MERARPIFGDWRDLRGAIEAHDPAWRERSEDERNALWDFADGVIRNFEPLRAQCGHCRRLISWTEAFRCADCRMVLCEDHTRQHFGPNHRPHDRKE